MSADPRSPSASAPSEQGAGWQEAITHALRTIEATIATVTLSPAGSDALYANMAQLRSLRSALPALLASRQDADRLRAGGRDGTSSAANAEMFDRLRRIFAPEPPDTINELADILDHAALGYSERATILAIVSALAYRVEDAARDAARAPERAEP